MPKLRPSATCNSRQESVFLTGAQALCHKALILNDTTEIEYFYRDYYFQVEKQLIYYLPYHH